jgi:hypothetical protein
MKRLYQFFLIYSQRPLERVRKTPPRNSRTIDRRETFPSKKDNEINIYDRCISILLDDDRHFKCRKISKVRSNGLHSSATLAYLNNSSSSYCRRTDEIQSKKAVKRLNLFPGADVKLQNSGRCSVLTPLTF